MFDGIDFRLRPYQEAAVTAIRAAFAHGHRRVLFVLATGGGKTIVFAFIALNAAAKGNRVIILAHRQEIADQISIALTSMGVTHGRIQSGHAMTNDLVQVGMVQTVANRLHTITTPTLVVIDEAHHAVAATWAKVLAAWPDARVLGVTATPERLDGRGLRAVFDDMVVGPDVRTLINLGYLAEFRYFAASLGIDLARVRTIGGDYSISDLADVLDRDTITGDVVEHYLKHLAGRTAIAFCVNVAHAEHIALRFRDSGITAASIDGAMSPDERRARVDALRSGDLRVLTSCEIISEGFDAPAVGGAILLRPTQSFALHRQQVGRALRPKPDGSPAVILDHVGNVHRHGLPDAPHAWSLDSECCTQADRNAVTAAIKEAVRTCSACSQVLAVGTPRHRGCLLPGAPDCIYGPPRSMFERAGELQEMLAPSCFAPDWAHGIDLRTTSEARLSQAIHHAGTDRGRLEQIQRARGYKRGWVHYAHEEALEREREERAVAGGRS